MPTWFWLSLAAMAAAMLHILLDFGVGLFPMRGRLSMAEVATLLLIILIHVWWVLSIALGAQGRGGGVASAAILALGWTTVTNGYPIVFCPPACPEAAPLADVAHIGSLVLGVVAAAVCLWVLLRSRVQIGWTLPSGALLLVLTTISALSHAAVDLPGG